MKAPWKGDPYQHDTKVRFSVGSGSYQVYMIIIIIFIVTRIKTSDAYTYFKLKIISEITESPWTFSQKEIYCARKK